MADERYAEFIEETPQTWIQGLFEESSTQKYKLGTRRRISDGREFIYGHAGASNLAVGKLMQASLPDTANTANLAVTNVANAVANAVRQITVTNGDHALANTANAYAEGYVAIQDGTGLGYLYKIKNHPAIAANANGVFTLYDKLRANLTNAHVTLIKHPCEGILIHASPPTAGLVGVTLDNVTANYFAWFQTKGPASVLVQGTLVIGDTCIADATTDGAVGPSANGQETEIQVGRVIDIGANGEYGIVDLNL